MVGFVILHYAHDGVTINCIESIRKCCKNSDYKIVIVDNASPNDSGKKIADYIKNSNDCVLLTSEKNLGFANGNNLGYKYAKEHYDLDYMFVMNNDTVLETENVEEVLNKIHTETNFDVLGPDIYLPSGVHQNPYLDGKLRKKSEIIQIFNRFKKILRFYLFWHLKNNIKRKLGKPYSKIDGLNAGRKVSTNIHERKEEVLLFGACYILAKSFIEQEEYVFDPRTFMYMEEDIFTYQNIKKGYKTIYDNQVKVKHLHGVSTNQSSKGEYDRNKKRCKNLVNSLKIYLQILEENGD